jgi:glycosyltransferase involved in cell wall biosynthesis
MPPSPCTLILQRRSHRAGGQVALWRLLSTSAFKAINPVLVTQNEGWLSAECRALGIPVIVMKFSSPRTLWGRLAANRLFCARLVRQVRAMGLHIGTVIGNDHFEGPFTAMLSRSFGAANAVILRSADATKDRLIRYRCEKADLLLPVGAEFHQDVAAWFPNHLVREIGEGLLDSDFHSIKPQSADFPTRILVIGSGHPLKGWQDMIAACDLLSQDAPFSDLQLDFTGDRPSSPGFDDLLERPRTYGLNFIGRSDDFSGLVRRYELVVQPTQCESFGLAGFEVLAVGVPLLTSRVGDVVKVLSDERWLFDPCAPQSLADGLRRVWQEWQNPPFPADEVQARIRQDFHIEPVAKSVLAHLAAVAAEPTT